MRNRVIFCVIALWLVIVSGAQTPEWHINRERMTETFITLAKIESGSDNEGEIGRFLMERLRALGADTVEMDEAHKQIGGTGGNVIARFKGTTNAPPLLLNAHMDTVSPTPNIQIVREGDLIRTDGSTILGADNKAGIAIILEVLQTLKERNLPHPPLEVVFTIREEKGLLGAKAFDPSKLRARHGLVVDGREIPEEIFIQSPTHWRFEVVFTGRASHAGAEPEKGRNAIVMASKAIAQMTWGRIDPDTSANVGVIEGGQAMNIVPDRVKLVGEFRSFDPDRVKALAEKWKAACEQVAQEMEGTAEVTLSKTFDAVRTSPDSPLAQSALKVMRQLGVDARLTRTGGGSDANVFAGYGIDCLVFPTGAADIHSTKENLILPNFYRCGEGVLRIVVEWAGHSK
ncbi:MAG: M20/M25/M40 family metallo-hydrolase [Fimbriimonadales bacterium]